MEQLEGSSKPAVVIDEQANFIRMMEGLRASNRQGEVGVGKDDRAGSFVLRDENADAVVGLSRGEARYKYDTRLMARGWQQYDTEQDAWYFGTWVHTDKRLIFCYAEGDRSVVYCDTPDSFRRELEAMQRIYGDPPPAFRSIDVETGQITHYIQERPRG